MVERSSPGLRQMKEGVIRTINSEVRTAIPVGIAGAALGAAESVISLGEKSLLPTMALRASEGVAFGGLVGWEYAAHEYNKTAAAKGLPQTEWYDWAAVNLIHVLRMVAGKTPQSYLGWFVTTQVVNPITFSGARHAIGEILKK